MIKTFSMLFRGKNIMSLINLRNMNESNCPVCGVDKSQWCDCSPIFCPHCGQLVRWFGKSGDINQCAHVVAWGTLGNEFIVWENDKYELKFHKHYSNHSSNNKQSYEEFDEDIFHSEATAIESFAKEEDLICEWEDCDEIRYMEEYGCWSGRGYVVFLLTK